MLLNFAGSIQQLDSVGEMRPGFISLCPICFFSRRFYEHLTALIQRISPFRHGAGVGLKGAARIGEAARGRVTMDRVFNEILAYSCVAAFVTGIVVLAAATFIG